MDEASVREALVSARRLDGRPLVLDIFARSRRLEDEGLKVVGRIPFDVSLARTADDGLPLVLGDPTGPIAYEFARIGAGVRRWLRDEAPQVREQIA